MMKGFVPFPRDLARRYREKGYWDDRTIADTFRAVCSTYSDRIAICNRDNRVTYGELAQRAQTLALNLLDVGFRPGEIVVLQLGNELEFVYTYLALQEIGVRPVLALHTHRYRELKQFVEISGARATITPDRLKDCDFIAIVDRIASETDSLTKKIVLGTAPSSYESLNALLRRRSSRDPRELDEIQRNIDPEEPALFLLSGGTTGIPKLIPRSHNDYICNSKLALSCTGVHDDSVLLDVLPIAHNLPLACPGLQGFLLKGATTVLHTSTRASEVFELVQRFRVTHVHVVPSLLIKWINDPQLKRYDLSSLRVIQSGGQSMPPKIRLQTERLLPNCRVQENFGMAEGLLMFVRLDDPEEVRLKTVGRPVCEDDEVLLLDDNNEPVQFGEVGELCCRGPYTLCGYFNAPEHNANAFTPDGFYRSGDLMRQHESGNFIVAGRKKDIINRGGEKISAEEVEHLILAHPDVINVACVAMPDPILGEKMCAFVIVRERKHLDLDELNDTLLQAGIAKFKLPERLEVVDHLPLSAVGKVSKKALSQRIAGQLTREAVRI